MVLKLLGMHLRIKKLHLNIFIHAQHWQNSFPVSYYYPLAEEKITHSQGSAYLKIFSPSSKNWEKGTMAFTLFAVPYCHLFSFSS